MYDTVYRQQGKDQFCESGFIESGSGYGSGSSISNESGSGSGSDSGSRYGSRVLITKKAKVTKIQKKNFLHLFLIKNCNLLIHRSPKRTSKLQEKPSYLKREHPALLGHFALLDPDYRSGLRIWIPI
jgi:hypothetical protein